MSVNSHELPNIQTPKLFLKIIPKKHFIDALDDS